MRHCEIQLWYHLCISTFLRTINIPGSGAAGGMGAALLAFCETTLTKGIDVIFDITDFHILFCS
jgi:glycerate kinase